RNEVKYQVPNSNFQRSSNDQAPNTKIQRSPSQRLWQKERLARFGQRASCFPSPRPSPPERGRIVRCFLHNPARVLPDGPFEQPNCRRLFPLPELPEGEGQGEGKRR